MSINHLNKPFSLKIKASLLKKLLILLPHLFAVGLIFLIEPFPGYLGAFLLALIILSAIYYYRLHISKKLKQSVYYISQDSAKNWLVTTRGDMLQQVTLLDSSFTSNFLIIINYIDINKNKYCVIIMHDSLANDEFRRLLLRLNLT